MDALPGIYLLWTGEEMLESGNNGGGLIIDKIDLINYLA